MIVHTHTLCLYLPVWLTTEHETKQSLINEWAAHISHISTQTTTEKIKNWQVTLLISVWLCDVCKVNTKMLNYAKWIESVGEWSTSRSEFYRAKKEKISKHEVIHSKQCVYSTGIYSNTRTNESAAMLLFVISTLIHSDLWLFPQWSSHFCCLTLLNFGYIASRCTTCVWVFSCGNSSSTSSSSNNSQLKWSKNHTKWPLHSRTWSVCVCVSHGYKSHHITSHHILFDYHILGHVQWTYSHTHAHLNRFVLDCGPRICSLSLLLCLFHFLNDPLNTS